MMKEAKSPGGEWVMNAPGMDLRAGHRPSALISRFRSPATVMDASEVEQVLADDAVIEDRRTGPGERVTGSELLVDRMRFLRSQGPGALSLELMAIRGDHLALARASSLRPDGQITSSLVVSEVSSSGEVVRLHFHDLDDVGGAVRSLAELYIESLDPPSAATMLAAATCMYALASRAYVRARAVFSDDLRHVDYRESPPFTTDVDGVMEGLRLILADEDVVDIVREVHAINGRGMVITRAQVTPDTLEEVGREVLVVGVRAGRVDLTEIYEFDDFDRAAARLQELTEA